MRFDRPYTAGIKNTFLTLRIDGRTQSKRGRVDMGRIDFDNRDLRERYRFLFTSDRASFKRDFRVSYLPINADASLEV